MDRFRIDGPVSLRGEVEISGAKNAALPCLAAALLTAEPVRLSNLPEVRDIRTMRSLLQHIGAFLSAGAGETTIEAREIGSADAPYDLVKTMRASVLVLGPLLARSGSVRVSLPGGCAIGVRPIDLHLAAFEKLGAEVRLEHGYVQARAGRLTGAEIAFPSVTVTGTENAMLAASLARGTTRLVNAAREPEVVDLARLLRAMGARIEGEGTETIVLEGVEALHGAAHAIVPDRIEAGTYAVAAALTRGDVVVRRCRPDHLKALTTRLTAIGARIETDRECLRVTAQGRLDAHDVATSPYPGFPTDLQAQWMALATSLDGISTVTETVFENRFQHVPELVRMGARIRLEGRWAVVEGPAALTGASVMASDLRASAALVLAGLAARVENGLAPLLSGRLDSGPRIGHQLAEAVALVFGVPGEQLRQIGPGAGAGDHVALGIGGQELPPRLIPFGRLGPVGLLGGRLLLRLLLLGLPLLEGTPVLHHRRKLLLILLELLKLLLVLRDLAGCSGSLKKPPSQLFLILIGDRRRVEAVLGSVAGEQVAQSGCRGWGRGRSRRFTGGCGRRG
jgi:UDP-N-acetylglucosamine 1-carboxyvinyltransferase